jgi:predicted RecB family nuclease
MIARVRTVTTFAGADPATFMADKRKTIFAGIGPDTLMKFHDRARLLTTAGAKPFLRAAVTFPGHDCELFFDIEDDPLRGICYLHGFIERRNRDNATERFTPFFAEEATPAAEKAAFAAAMAYWRERRPCAVYYYSKHERTYYRVLQEKYPDVCTQEEIEQLFDPVHAVDLYYDVVRKATEWPTNDHSIKTLAKYLGFAWRDTHPSGAASIEWFNRWIETRDPQIRQRILDYNEDDCRATRVLLEGIRALPQMSVS